METNYPSGFNTRAGTAGGTLLVVFLQISADELAKTSVLAAVGAIVSFCVSLLLKYLVRYIKRKR